MQLVAPTGGTVGVGTGRTEGVGIGATSGGRGGTTSKALSHTGICRQFPTPPLQSHRHWQAASVGSGSSVIATRMDTVTIARTAFIYPPPQTSWYSVFC